MTRATLDWQSTSSHLLRPPQTDDSLSVKCLPKLPGHLWLQSSGSTGKPKLIALSKQAMLNSAAAVNAHLRSDATDHWFSALPHYHVAGLGIEARCHLSRARLSRLQGRWSAPTFARQIREHKATLSALVPTQLHDLVSHRLSAPPGLRAVVIGGARLTPELYQAGRQLGWPLLPSYGMTECASQVATASLASLEQTAYPRLQLLPHLQHRLSPEGRLMLKGPSLLTGMLSPDAADQTLHDPKIDGWLITRDQGRLDQGAFRFAGRSDWLFKIRGHQVALETLQQRWQSLHAGTDSHLIAHPHPRDGHQLALVVAGAVDAAIWQAARQFNRQACSHERIRRLYSVETLSRSGLGKFQHARQLQALQRAARASIRLPAECAAA